MSRHPFSVRNTDTTVEITLIGHDFILPVDEAELLATALLFAVLRAKKPGEPTSEQREGQSMTNELDRQIAEWTSKTDQNVTVSRDGLRTMESIVLAAVYNKTIQYYKADLEDEPLRAWALDLALCMMAEEIDRRITAARRTDAPPADSGGGDNV